MDIASVQRKANAKVNFSLSVGKPLHNGMHPIESKMSQIELFDDLEVTKLDLNSLSRYAILWHEDAPVQTEIDWPIQEDLAVKAHLALEHEAGCLLPVQMKLTKRIPVGGGIGGGSSDAAAMLLATSELFSLDFDLEKIASSLGSDVPFFLQDSPAIVRGIGNQIERLDLECIHLVLIFPPYGCCTRDVYAAFDVLEQADSENLNDLHVPACHIEPRLHADILRVQDSVNIKTHLSGSGSTCFVICDNAEHATESAEKIKKETGLVVRATCTC